MLGSSVVPDLLETMKIVLAEVYLVREGLHLGRIRGVQHEQLRIAVLLPERHSEDFRAQAGSAHSEQQSLLESGGFYVGRDIF